MVRPRRLQVEVMYHWHLAPEGTLTLTLYGYLPKATFQARPGQDIVHTPAPLPGSIPLRKAQPTLIHHDHPPRSLVDLM